MAEVTAPLTASDVVAAGCEVLATLKAQLLEDSATSRRACVSAEDALGAWSKELTLLVYEVARQKKVAADRTAREAEAKAAHERKASAEIKARHEAVLRREIKHRSDLRDAEAFAKNQKGST